MNEPLILLLIEDNPHDRTLIKRGLQKAFSSINIIDIFDLETLESNMLENAIDFVITDYRLGWTNGIEILKTVKEINPYCPVLMFTVMGTEEIAVEAMKLGLDDYVLKSPSQFARLPEIVKNLLSYKEQKEALQAAEERYGVLFERMPIGLFRSTPDGEIIEANQALLDILGYPDRESLMSINAKELYISDTPPDSVYDPSSEYRNEIKVKNFDNTIIDIKINMQRVFDEAGNVQYYEGSIEDITKRKMIERQRERMLAAERKRTNQLATLTQAATTIVSNLEIKTIIKSVAEQLVKLAGAESCTISQWNPEDSTINLLVEHNAQPRHRDIHKWYLPHKIDENWPKLQEMIRTQKPVQVTIDDADLPNSTKEYMIEEQLQSVLMVPLITQDQLLGLVELEVFDSPRKYTPQEVSLVQTLCNQAVVAMENARLFEETRLQLQELEVLHAIATYAVEVSDENKFIGFATRLISKTFHWHEFGVLLIDKRRGVIRTHPTYISEEPANKIELPLGKGIVGEVAQTGKMLNVPKTSDYESYYVLNESTQSKLCVPLKINDVIIGVLNAESIHTNAFSSNDEQMMLTLASQISSILERMRALASEAKHARQLEILNILISQMAELPSEEELFHLVLNKLVRDFGYYSCAVFTEVPGEEEVVLRHVAGGGYEPKIKPEEYRQSIHTGLIGRAYNTKEVIFSNNTLDDPDYFNMGDDKIQSEVSIPLMIDNKPIGILLISEDKLDAFSDIDISTLTTLADSMSVSMEKARLFETERIQRENAETLRQVATILSNTIDIDQTQILETILQMLKRVVDYNSASVFLIKGNSLVAEAHFGQPKIVTTGEFQFTLEENIALKPVINNMETRLIPDIEQEPHWISIPGLESIKCIIAAPLIIRKQCIGVLTIDGHQGNQFDQNDADMVTAFANHASSAIENTNLFNEISDALEREQQLNSIAHKLSEGLGTDAVFEEIIELACHAVGADTSFLALVQPDHETLAFPIVHNPMPVYDQRFFKRGTSILWEIIENQRSVLLNEYPKYSKAILKPDEIHFNAYIGVPVIAGDEVIGTLGLIKIEPDDPFTQRDLELIESIGRQLGIAVHNSKLFQETALALEREQQLNQITRTISSTLDLDAILEKVSQQAVELVGGTTSSIVLIDVDKMTADRLYAFKRPKGVDYTIPEKDDGLGWEVVRSKEPIMLQEYISHPKARKIWKNTGIHAAIIVPIIYQETAKGVLSVFSDNPEKSFSQRDLELLESVGRQAGIAINNAQLFSQITQRSNELSALYEIALATGSILDSESLLQQIRVKVQHLINPDSFGVVLNRENNNEYQIMIAMEKNKRVSQAIGERYQLDQGGFTGWMMKQRKTLHIKDTKTETLPVEPIKITNDDIRTYLGIPLIAHDRLIGGILVQSLKPNAFSENDQRLLESLAGQIAIALENAQLYEELEETMLQTVLALANAMDARDTYTQDHSQRMAVIAVEVGKALECNNEELETLHWAALLHDIGKIGVPDEILLKPGQLTKEEYKIIQKHPRLGADIISPIKKLNRVAPLIQCHQEWYNGKGYPNGLKGKKIPLGARILAVVDAYIAMTDDRIYRSARSNEEAIRELVKNKKVQFDPQVVDVFVELFKKKKWGEKRKNQ